MAKKLTTFEWFLTIQDTTVRARAVRAMRRRQLPHSSLSEAIKGGIVWHHSKEGVRYWRNKYEYFKSLEPQPKTNWFADNWVLCIAAVIWLIFWALIILIIFNVAELIISHI